MRKLSPAVRHTMAGSGGWYPAVNLSDVQFQCPGSQREPHAAAGAVARLPLSRFRRRRSLQSRAVDGDAPGAPGGWGTMHGRSSRPPCGLLRLVLLLSLQISCRPVGSHLGEHATHGRPPPLPKATTPFYCRSRSRGEQATAPNPESRHTRGGITRCKYPFANLSPLPPSWDLFRCLGRRAM